MAIIGLLPASGKASRLAGIPKFLLPVPGAETLLHWHVERMRDVCDEVRVSTRAEFAARVEMLGLPITLFVKEPSTMSDALAHMAGERSDDDFVVGMPDTIVADSAHNFYRTMTSAAAADPAADAVIGAFECPAGLRGQVGQIDVDEQGLLRCAADKDPRCTYPLLWGGLLLRRGLISDFDRASHTPSSELQRWVDRGLRVRVARCSGRYVDVGNPAAVASLGIEA
jgi:hypothetical protein